MIKRFLIQGVFSETDFRELMETLRRIEERHPAETYLAMIVESAPDLTEGEAMDFLERIYPTRPLRELEFSIKKRHER